MLANNKEFGIRVMKIKIKYPIEKEKLKVLNHYNDRGEINENIHSNS